MQALKVKPLAKKSIDNLNLFSKTLNAARSTQTQQIGHSDIRVDFKSITKIVPNIQPKGSKIAGCKYVTMNYDIFKTNKYNRNLNQKNIKRLIASFKQYNNLGIPIIVDKDFNILDGHHRLEVLKMLGLPVYYVVVDINAVEPEKRIQILSTINNASAKWSLIDYLDRAVKMHNAKVAEYPNCIYLYNLSKKYTKFNIQTLLRVTCGENSSSTRGLKEGKDVIFCRDLDKVIDILDVLESADKVACNTSRSMILALKWLYSNKKLTLNEIKQTLAKKCTDYNTQRFSSSVSALDYFCEKYNNKRKTNKLYLHDEYAKYNEEQSKGGSRNE